MFERFTQDARRAVVNAQDEARGLGHGWIGTEHLLIAVLGDEGSPVATALREVGLTPETVREEVRRQLGPVDDGTALAGIGIDLDEVRRRVEDRFGPGALDEPCAQPTRRGLLRRIGRRSPAAGGWPVPGPGHIPFTRRAKKSLELALREAMAARSREIHAGHLVLGLMREDGLAARAVTSLGVPPETVRRRVLALDRAA
jgi:ATP-dependent Clp protease ATP-binding subunit ClpA